MNCKKQILHILRFEQYAYGFMQCSGETVRMRCKTIFHTLLVQRPVLLGGQVADKNILTCKILTKIGTKLDENLGNCA